MHVTHIQSIFSREHGGPLHSTSNCCLEQRRLGHQVSLRVLGGFPGTSPVVQIEGGIDQKIFQVNGPAKLGYSSAFRIFSTNDHTPDIYHIHGVWHLMMAQAAENAARCRRPYVLEMMGSYTDYELKRKWTRKTLARHLYQDRVLNRAACIHVNSPAEGEVLRRLGFKTPITCLPVGVDLGATRKLINETNALGQLQARPYLLYLGRIHPTKGVDRLLAAWRIARKNTGDYRLLVAGEGEPDYVKDCRKLSAEMEAAGDCEWIGHVTEKEKIRLYRGATAYVLPSLNENFGNTVAEAFACGTPVVTTYRTQWGMLEQRECGWLAEPDVDSLRNALERCLDAGELERRRRGALGRKMVEEEYSIEVVVAKMIELYRGIIGGKLPAHLLM